MNKKILATLTGVLIGAALLAEALVLSQNNLLNNKMWIVEKAMVNPTLSGADESLVSRSVLAAYALNLNEAHGYQDISLRQPENLDRFAIDLVLEEGAYVDILFAQDPEKRQGLRLSTRPIFPGGLYQVNAVGEFHDWQNRPEAVVTAGFHRIFLQRQPTRIDLNVDGKILSVPTSLDTRGHLEFRGSSQAVRITQVQAFQQGRRQWRESFHSWSLWIRLFITWFLVFALFALLFSFPRRAVFRGVIFLALWLCFDFFYFSRMEIEYVDPPTRSIQPTVSYMNFENGRRLFFESLLRISGVDARSDHRHFVSAGYTKKGVTGSYCDAGKCSWHRGEFSFPEKKPDEIRLLLTGGSFFEGKGIRRVENTLLQALWEKVRALRGPSFQVTALNLSRSGQHGAEAMKLFLAQHPDYKPDYIFLGSPYFPDPDRDSILELGEYCRRNRIRLVVLEAPKNREYESRDEEASWAAEVLAPHHISALILSEVSLDSKTSRSGFLWWDRWHMTDYGGQRINEFVKAHLNTQD